MEIKAMKTERQIRGYDAPETPENQDLLGIVRNFVHVCAWCERELGPVATLPGQIKSHGICRRHSAELLRGAGVSNLQIQARFTTIDALKGGAR